MKRFLLFLGVLLLMTGIRVADRGLLRLSDSGRLTVYEDGAEKIADELPAVNRIDGYYRFDVAGMSADEAIKKLAAKVLWAEELNNVTVYYAYSPYLKLSKLVKGRVVNLMLAENALGISAGTPLLKGSY